jgi:uncharacterized surface protein with fasciclin (FAS1) repeats
MPNFGEQAHGQQQPVNDHSQPVNGQQQQAHGQPGTVNNNGGPPPPPSMHGSDDSTPSHTAYNELVSQLKSNHPTLLSLLQGVPSLLDKVKHHADKISVLAPIEPVFKSLKPVVVKFLTHPKNAKLLEDILGYHIISNTAVTGAKHDNTLKVNKLYTTAAHNQEIMSGVTAMLHDNQGVKPSVSSGGHTFFAPTDVHESNTIMHTLPYPSQTTSTIAAKQLAVPHWLQRSSPGNNWT